MKSDGASRIFLGIFFVLWLTFSGLVYYVHTNYEDTKTKLREHKNTLTKTTKNIILIKKKRLLELSNLVGYHEAYEDNSLQDVYSYIELKQDDSLWNNTRTSLDAIVTKIEAITSNSASVRNKEALGITVPEVKIDKKDLIQVEGYSSKIVTLEKLWNEYTSRIEKLQSSIKVVEDDINKNKKEYDDLIVAERKTIVSLETEIEEKKQAIEDLRTEKEELLKEEEDKRKKAQLENSEERDRLAELNEQKRIEEQKYKEEISDLDQRISELKDEAAGQTGIDRWFQNQKRQAKQQEMPDGEIIYVNQKLKIAYINIGRSQGVLPGLKFDVFRYGKGGQKIAKGKIEVKKVRDKMSMVGILSTTDDLSPITNSDKIINAVYDKNKVKYFVIAGNLVQKYSRTQVKRMVAKIGGTVEDEITAKTDFIILGKNFADDAIYKRAAQLGIETMLESEFIQHLDNWEN
ncbi:BRCT domain-containing protein [Candidatus Uabimicrobium sp. HlEnr_7]|uniref:BRCT domain-containing protein n=1 Tax=Candidatus Uabimicrobium helgolandensis TaxID=3095367 RepID=UPI00355714E8